ncbi:MAG: hypothetical protein H6534_00555 [Chthonomonadaceae bacterium]|nr:hypothetical protein [Chthonomonadaceae bacterium]
MPHIVLETSADVLENDRIPDILEGLVAELSGCESVDPASIKAYHGLRGNWVMGAGAPRGFVHCEVRLLAGRSAELRAEIAERMLGRLRGHVSESLEAGEISLTVEVREMDSDAYRKTTG